MAYLAARAGVTTTGHLKIDPAELVYPWGYMALTSLVGAAMALLGVLRPVREVLRLGVVNALRPRFAADGAAPAAAQRSRLVRWLALPVLVIGYVIGRPSSSERCPRWRSTPWRPARSAWCSSRPWCWCPIWCGGSERCWSTSSPAAHGQSAC